MKTPSNELFLLIKSMVTQEKVFFKTQSQGKQKDSLSYLQLFDAINEMERYDEKILKEKLKKKGFKHNLKKAKNYLNEALLRSLQDFHSTHSVDAQLCNNIRLLQILVNKRLCDQARKMMLKTEKLAYDHHRYYYMSLLQSIHRELIIAEMDIDVIKTYIKDGTSREDHEMELFENLVALDRLNVQAIEIRYNQLEGSEQRHGELRELLKHPLLQDESKALTMVAKMRFYGIIAHSAYVLKDVETCYTMQKKLLALMEQYPSYIKDKPEPYVVLLGSFLVTLVSLKNTSEILAHIKKSIAFVDSLPPKQQSSRILRSRTSIRINHVNYLLSIFEVEEALKLCKNLEEDIQRYYAPQSYLVFHSNLFVMHFYMGDFKKALHKINEVLNSEEAKIEFPMIGHLKLMNVMLHYELGNLEMLPGMSRSVARYIEGRYGLGESEKMLLDFLGKKVLKSGPGKERIKAFSDFRKAVEPKLSRQLGDDFDLLSWIDSKIKGRTMLELMKETRKV